jgi:peptide/nickel transport system substrate-binding protein
LLRRAILGGLFSLILALPGAAQAAQPTASAPAVLRVGVLGSPGSLNPVLYASPVAADVLGATSDGLLSYRPASRGGRLHYVWRPDLLAAMPQITVTGTPGPQAEVTIVYRLRRGLRWSDGKPLTSQDIRFTWRAIMTPANGAYQAGYNQITAIDTPDRLTAVIHMQGTFAAWQTLFSALLPWHALHRRTGSIATDAGYNDHPLGTGPYMVRSYTGSTALLVPNPYYLGQDGPRPAFRQVAVEFFHRQSSLLAALNARQVAVADLLTLNTATVHQLRANHLTVVSVPSTVFEQFTFNLQDPVASDPMVRRAFYLALDRQAMAAQISGGRWQVATSDQPPWSWAFNPKVPVVHQSIAKARAILQQDGWQIGKDGYFQKGGQELVLDVSLTRTPLHQAIMRIAVAQAALAGIRLVPAYFTTQALFGPNGMLAQGTFQVAEFGLMDNVDPDDAAIWNSSLGSPYHQGDDFSNYRNANVDAWTADALAQMNPSLRAQDYRQVQQQLYSDLPMVPLFYTSAEAAYDPTLVGHISLSAFSGAIWSLNAWRAPKH